MLFSSRKAQASAEFMAYVVMLLVVLLVAAFIAINTTEDVRTESANNDAKRIAYVVASEINMANEIGDGYTRRFFIPEQLKNGENFSLNVASQRITVSWSNANYSLPLTASNITGSPIKGYNTMKNIGGVVVFV